jgi:hypothetical protein
VTRSRVVAPIVAILIFYLILASSLNITRSSNATVQNSWTGTIQLKETATDNCYPSNGPGGCVNVDFSYAVSENASFSFTSGAGYTVGEGSSETIDHFSGASFNIQAPCGTEADVFPATTLTYTTSYNLDGFNTNGQQANFTFYINGTSLQTDQVNGTYTYPSSGNFPCTATTYTGSTYEVIPSIIGLAGTVYSNSSGLTQFLHFTPELQDGNIATVPISASYSSGAETISVTGKAIITLSSSSSVSTTASSVSTTAFDFTISMPVQNPGFCPPSSPTTCLVVFAGDSTESNAINLGLSAGSSAPQQVTLSVSSLPPGVSANFIPSSVIPPGSTTLKIQTSSVFTPAGNYTITVTGSGPGGTPSHSAAFVLRVDVIPYAQAESDGAAYLTHDGKTEAVTPGAGSPFALQPGDSLTTQSGYTSITFPGVHDNLIIGPGSRIDVHSESESTTEYEVSPTTGSPAYVYQSTYQKIVVFRYCDPQTGHCIYDVQATGCQTSQQGPAPPDVGACAGDPGFSLSVTNTSMLAQVYSGYVTVVDQNTNQSLVVQGGNELNATIGFTPTSPTTLNDTAAPDVTGTFPNSSNDTISASTPISVSFSKFIYPPSTAGSNFTVVGPGGTRVAGTWTAFGQTVVFTPSQPFSAGSFTVTVLGGPHGVSDLSGNVLPSDYSFSFSVASPVPPLSETEYRIIGFALIVGLAAAAALLITRIARGGGKGNKVPPPAKSQRW